jgi:flagellar basal-body rod modification protein FlgD
MMINPLDSLSTTVGSNGSVTPTMPTQTLGQADFLKLLVTQMTSQDPLNPQTGTDFVAQMAQFSSLSASQTMEADMSSLQASNLLGRTVSVTGSDNTQISGLVSAVQIQAGTPQIVVNGQAYDMSQITAISPAPATTPTTTN